MMEKRTGIVTFGGNPVTLLGKEVKIGEKAADFLVLTPELKPFHFHDIKGKVRVISVVPSIDTPVCDLQTKWFNQDAAQYADDLLVLSVSVDLPFALKRYCAAEGIDNVKTLSDHRELSFGLQYGFVIEELRLLSRGAVVIDRDDIVRYVEYVPVIGNQPDYAKVMAAVKACL